MEFPRQGYWNGLPFPSPGDLPNPGTEPGSPALHADSLPIEPPGKPEHCLLLILNNLIAQKILKILWYFTVCILLECQKVKHSSISNSIQHGLVTYIYIVGPISFHSIVLKFICRIEWNQFYGGLYSAFLDFFLNLSSLPYSLKYKFIVFIVVVQALSHLRLYNHMNCSMPDFLVLHHLPDIVQTHVRWVNDAIQSFHLLSPPSPPALNLF